MTTKYYQSLDLDIISYLHLSHQQLNRPSQFLQLVMQYQKPMNENETLNHGPLTEV